MKLTSHPWLLGALLGSCLLAFLFVTAIWVPWIWSQKNEWLMRLVFFSVIYLAVLISMYWNLRKRLRLWVSLAVLVLANVTCVLIFNQSVRQMGIWPLSFTFALEFFGAAVFLAWFLDSKRTAS